MAWLVDTNVLSELRRPRPDRQVVAFLATCPINQLYVSTITFMEIRFGIERASSPASRADLERWLAETIRPMFAGRVLEITEEIMLAWRRMVDDGRKTGRTFSQPDLILAATALQHDLTLVTRNVKDFDGLSVNVLNPWDS